MGESAAGKKAETELFRKAALDKLPSPGEGINPTTLAKDYDTHSFFTYILPYMEQDAAYRLMDLTKVYNDGSAPNNQAAARQKGFGFGVEVTTEPGQLSVPSSIGQFGWYGAATTYCQIDPKERIVAITLAQHFPFNEHNLFAQFQTAYYQALR